MPTDMVRPGQMLIIWHKNARICWRPIFSERPFFFHNNSFRASHRLSARRGPGGTNLAKP
jgi:hypothetical protein